MTIYFTSDTHFGHQLLIKPRHFSSKDEMDKALIDCWNAVARPNDTIYHLGDVSFRNTRETIDILNQLNGTIHLIYGNHDSRQIRNLPRWASVKPLAEIKIEGRKLILCHYKLATWGNSQRGTLHFYGHSHGTLPGDNQCLDVGIDAMLSRDTFRPISFAETQTLLAASPKRHEPDHHRPGYYDEADASK